MSKVSDQILDHNYDGILEYDNPLPPWWVTLFIITIIWGVLYIFYYHITEVGDSSTKDYALEVERATKLSNTPGGGSGVNINKADMIFMNDEANLNKGKEVFTKNCTACHGQNGEGGVGPNLTDNYWIHGGSFENIVTTIMNGVPEKGMLTWKNILKKEDILQVASYVKSIKGTKPSNPKAPQGTEFNE
jgi:cytochrome c oxidase cbb3-type subunit III